MPMIELTTSKGALDEDAKQRLAGELATLALELEAAPLARFGDAAHMQALAWCFVNEQDIFVGGQRHPKPIYRVTVTIPEGAPGVFGPLAAPNRQELIARATAAVLAAEGSENTLVDAHRVWVHLRHLEDGHWGGFGEVFTVNDAAAYGLMTDKPGGRLDRMRQAALESVAGTSAGETPAVSPQPAREL
jgi:phenylpyruvate tautomerase PptA (4-oxalocrotonate tautomerase family)